MRQRSHIISAIISCLIVIFFVTSPVLAGDSFSDLFSQTNICFPQIAVGGSDGWETEVAIINPTAKAVQGELNFYAANGSKLGAAFPLPIKAHGRYQVEVGKTFAGRGTIEYMTFAAPVYGLKGYTKFYTATMRASIMASSPQTSGLFTKIDHAGWTGIAFVNTSDADALVTLTAYSDNGDEVATKVMSVKAGEKVVKTAKDIFAPQPLAEASYVSFDSDQGIVGFFLNGSFDGSKLDGSKAL